MIWLSLYRDFFMQNLLKFHNEKILLIPATVFGGHYPGTYTISTEDLNDGADTFLEILQADGLTPVLQTDGSPASNDNYIPYVQSQSSPTRDGGTVVVERSWLDYNGQCGRVVVFVPGGVGTATLNSCPPNAANPPPPRIRRVPDYLASRVAVPLQPGTYYARVSRAPGAPPSAGRYGGYGIRVSGAP